MRRKAALLAQANGLSSIDLGARLIGICCFECSTIDTQERVRPREFVQNKSDAHDPTVPGRLRCSIRERFRIHVEPLRTLAKFSLSGNRNEAPSFTARIKPRLRSVCKCRRLIDRASGTATDCQTCCSSETLS